jgi:outer membrane protein OmpA-like peptidoglycan-associated protein
MYRPAPQAQEIRTMKSTTSTHTSLKDTINRTARYSATALFLAASFGASAIAQEPNPTVGTQAQQAGAPATQQDGVYIYRVKVVQRDLDAVNYLHRSGSTTINFEGTPLLPRAKGRAKVQSERGTITIDADFQGLTPANGFGPEYLTYVLWAITPDGRPQNLGEILPSHNKNNIHVTTAFQSFGMIVTAEPYFAVSQPSDVVVLQNVIRQDKTQGVLEKVNAHYTLLPRGLYAETAGAHTVSDPITRNLKSPLEIYEAHNAFRIAQSVGAEKYSPDIMMKAQEDLRNADDLDSNKHGDRKMEITFAREAVQRSEDARIDTLRKQAAERQRNADLAQQQAQQQAQQSQLEAANSALAAEQANAAKEKADADRARAEADAADARARAAEATRAANKSTDDANAIREKLRAQLNAVLQTNETARGLIVNMSDVLFDSGRYTIKPDTKIALAKVSGILEAYPGLKVQVEGYTDSIGGDAYNQKLSENRADSVEQFLVTQGVPQANVTATGYGKADPVADNGTSAGRAQNRRVQLVVSGNAIGIDTQSAPTTTAAPAQ